MKKLKIYIVGSITTRACFDYIPKEKYSDIYDIVGVQYQSSIISLMSDPVTYENIDLDELNGWSKKVIKRDFDKSFKNEMIKEQPDYIIIDLVSDVEYGVIETPHSYITKINGKTNKLDLTGLSVKELTLKKNKETYLRLFDEKMNQFKLFCKNKLPNTKIIFHISPFLYSYFDDCRVKRSFIDKNLIWKNKIINMLYEYSISENDLVIDLNEKTYFATAKHNVSLNPIHYETQYYIDFIDKLNFIVLRDILKKG